MRSQIIPSNLHLPYFIVHLCTYSQRHCRWRSRFLAYKTLNFGAISIKFGMYAYFWHTKKYSQKNLKYCPKWSKSEKGINCFRPGKIHFLIKRHVHFLIDSFWTKEWSKIKNCKNLQFLVEIFEKCFINPFFCKKIIKHYNNCK